jgi:hypothetical protein
MKRSFGLSQSPIAAVIAVFLTAACAAGQEVASATPASTTNASTQPAPSVAASSAGSSASQSPTPTPILWTQASLKEDWPAPVRDEPAGGSIVLPILLKTVLEGTNCPGDCSSTTQRVTMSIPRATSDPLSCHGSTSGR